jgi:uncharacterized protein (TIGR02145 family)
MKNRNWLYLIISVFPLIISCEKEKNVISIMNPWVVYGSVTDRQGNTYKTIDIGDQKWMVKNLTTTLLNDGTPIPVVKDADVWNNLTTPACCWQNNDTARKVTYGVLYNWFAVNTRKLCPVGWHVSSDEEWTAMIEYLGGEGLAGGKLKETGFKHWASPNTGATNETYFWAFPGGYRSAGSEALFENLLKTGSWWTVTTHNEDMAINRLLYYDSNSIQKFFFPKKSGLSVRCLQN